MAEVSDITIKRTQDSLGKLIKKPQLTDKLLRKPPFKFLHDIINAVITNTGLFAGLYTNDELQSENIKDRDAKIAFLQKAIDTLKIATKQDLRARPSKIVAGLEAEKTNEFLIAIAKAIDRKIDTAEAVAQVKSGNVNGTQKKEPKAAAAATKAESRPKGGRDTNESKKVKSSDTKPLKKTDANKKAAPAKQSSKESSDGKKPKSRTSSQVKEPKNGTDKKVDSGKKLSQKNAEPETKTKSIEPPQSNVANVVPITNGAMSNFIDDQETKPSNQIDPVVTEIANTDEMPNKNIVNAMQQDEKQETNHQDIDQKPERIEKSAKSARSIDRNDRKSEAKKSIGENDVDAEALQNKKSEKIQLPKSGETMDSKNRSQELIGPTDTVPASNIVQDKAGSNDKPRSSKSRRPKRDAEQVAANAKPEVKTSASLDKLAERPSLLESSTTKSLEATNDSSSKARPAIRSAAARPISARPSAPRRRDRNVRQILHTESFVQDPNSQQKNKANKKNAIPEYDDADNIVITETIQDNISLLDENATNNDVTADIDGKQGHLVQQILETQTAILKADASKNDPSTANDDSILNNGKSFTRNTTELRKMIQKLSLYITPLGKMMEYFQEDVDAMQIELLMWQKAGAAAQADIKEEQRATEKLLENFKYHLAEINNSIKDHIEQINNTTTNIIQNEEKMSKLIATL